MATGIDRIGALDKAFEFIYKSETTGDYSEFGVYQGVSLARAMKANANWRRKTNRSYVNHFYAFDSFQGLPSFTDKDSLSNYEVFQEGQFSDTNPSIVKDRLIREELAIDELTIVEGIFSETLIQSNLTQEISDSKIAIAHIDCDLYASAVDCLNFLEHRLVDGAILLFDDWFCYRGRPDRGVHQAFSEWKVKADLLISDYFSYSWAGKAFIANSK